MPAEPQIERRAADVERAGGVEVEHVDVLPHPLLRLVAQRGALPLVVLVLEVEEPGDAGEGAEVADFDVEIAGELGGVADDAAAVVEVAVVVVGAGRQNVAAPADADGYAVRDGGVQAPPELAGAELDRLRGQRLQKSGEGEGARRQDQGAADRSRDGFPPGRRPGRAGFKNVPHGLSPVVVSLAAVGVGPRLYYIRLTVQHAPT